MLKLWSIAWEDEDEDSEGEEESDESLGAAEWTNGLLTPPLNGLLLLLPPLPPLAILPQMKLEEVFVDDAMEGMEDI